MAICISFIRSLCVGIHHGHRCSLLFLHSSASCHINTHGNVNRRHNTTKYQPSYIVATDFGGGNYTDDEMRVALIILSIILIIFLAICSCQCYQKFVWEIIYDEGRKLPSKKYSFVGGIAANSSKGWKKKKKSTNGDDDEGDGDSTSLDVTRLQIPEAYIPLDPSQPISQMPCAPYVRDMSSSSV